MTEEMQRHYSTVQQDEQRNAMAKVIDFMGVKAKLAA